MSSVCLFVCLLVGFVFCCSCCWFCRGFFVVAVVACLIDLLVCRFVYDMRFIEIRVVD